MAIESYISPLTNQVLRPHPDDLNLYPHNATTSLTSNSLESFLISPPSFQSNAMNLPENNDYYLRPNPIINYENEVMKNRYALYSKQNP